MSSGSGVTCPGCGTARAVDSFRRTAGEFCAVCDYPLFWAAEARSARSAASASGLGPRAAGAGWTTITCPSCTERNPAARDTCLRCGDELRPAPAPPPLPVEPLPPPAPEPRAPDPPPWWAVLRPQHLAAAVCVLGVLQVAAVALR